MQRHSSLRAPGKRSRPLDALPEQVLTDDWYRRCRVRWSAALPGWDCNAEMMATIDRAVADLVDKHGIVPTERKNGLREWIKYVVCGYFGLREAARREMTQKEVARCKERIDHLGMDLRQELVRLFGLGPHQEISALDELLSCAQRHEVLGDRPTRKGNASNDALYVLSKHICFFWIPGGWWSEKDKSQLPFDYSPGSPSLRFAKYMYAYVGAANCTDRMIVERLRAVGREITDAWQGLLKGPGKRRFQGFILGSSDED
jgi:hypothetical protein